MLLDRGGVRVDLNDRYLGKGSHRAEMTAPGVTRQPWRSVGRVL
jgi:hypothetical protein